MTRAVLLRLAATAATVVTLLASAGYVASHPKDDRAPLQPPVVKPSPTARPAPTGGRIQIQPGVRATELPAITGTHVS
ncbi:MAG: hypothetical protein HYY42_01505 [Chloroflexi bacterium]|nr:hypothetical protein [Chloroflexota bacterium]MBI2982861.1 hypothetical protein [Chloroflexota bacterium]